MTQWRRFHQIVPHSQDPHLPAFSISRSRFICEKASLVLCFAFSRVRVLPEWKDRWPVQFLPGNGSPDEINFGFAARCAVAALPQKALIFNLGLRPFLWA
ncbi:MAG: hypothetical protein DMF75_17295 [Acidobacteria bacterium]|nr:MAG: hypothetical protein DMF75_17295 [Acidobacteriota bacterium]